MARTVQIENKESKEMLKELLDLINMELSIDGKMNVLITAYKLGLIDGKHESLIN